jgi:hypothetical protein
MVTMDQCGLGHAFGCQGRLSQAFMDRIENHYIMGHEELTVHPPHFIIHLGLSIAILKADYSATAVEF